MCEDVSPSRLVWFAKISSRFLAFSALATWLGFIGLFFHYDATRPTIPQSDQGRVYPSNNHGHVVYLSEQDEDRLNLLQWSAFLLFMIAVVLDYVQRQQLTASQIQTFARSSFYWLCSPGSWRASVRQLRQYNTDSQPKDETSQKLRDYKRTGNKISFRTIKSISECQNLIRSAGYSAFGVVLEAFDGYDFCLSVRRNYRNSFAPLCTGRLIPQATGTVINVRFGMRPSVKIFLALWFVVMATVGGVILANVLSGNSSYPAAGIVVPLVLLGFGTLLVRFGNRLGHDEETYVIGWLERSFADASQEQVLRSW